MKTNLKIFLNVILLMSVMILINCAGVSYKYDNRSYSSPEAAHNAHLENLKKIENELKPYNTEPKGNAIIITPSKKTCQALGITTKGSPTAAMIDYLGDFLVDDYSYFANYLEISNIFESVKHVIHDYPNQYANEVKDDYTATIYLNMKSPTIMSWDILVYPNNQRRQLNMDRMADTSAKRIQSWLDDIKLSLEDK